MRKGDALDVIGPRFHQDPLRPRIAQPEKMHQRTRPHFDPMLASKLLLAHQSVEAPVPVVDIAARQMPPQVILLDPVEFEVTERFAVPAADGGEAVLAAQGLLEEEFLRFVRAGDAPEGGDAGLVHPVVQQVCVAGVDVDVAQ